jgi:putative RNA 2'-phosphotransferase
MAEQHKRRGEKTMDAYLVRLSKTIAHALRHAPKEYGLTLDEEGWVELDDLLNALRTRGGFSRNASRGDLDAIIEQSEKQRFEIRDGRIRAFYGHSVTTKIEHEPTVPPTVLYHGTTREAAETILREGLKSMKRQYVHLSTDVETAHKVGLRRTSNPVILHVAALKAHQNGINFYLGNEDIWMADPIPATFISR